MDNYERNEYPFPGVPMYARPIVAGFMFQKKMTSDDINSGVLTIPNGPEIFHEIITPNHRYFYTLFLGDIERFWNCWVNVDVQNSNTTMGGRWSVFVNEMGILIDDLLEFYREPPRIRVVIHRGGAGVRQGGAGGQGFVGQGLGAGRGDGRGRGRGAGGTSVGPDPFAAAFGGGSHGVNDEGSRSLRSLTVFSYDTTVLERQVDLVSDNPLGDVAAAYNRLHEAVLTAIFCSLTAGIIKPNSTCDYTVTMQAQKSAPLEMLYKDKFLTESAMVPFGTAEDEITTSMSAKNDKKYVEEAKLQVALISPVKTQTPEFLKQETEAFMLKELHLPVSMPVVKQKTLNETLLPKIPTLLKQEAFFEIVTLKKLNSPVLCPVNGVVKQEPSFYAKFACFMPQDHGILKQEVPCEVLKPREPVSPVLLHVDGVVKHEPSFDNSMSKTFLLTEVENNRSPEMVKPLTRREDATEILVTAHEQGEQAADIDHDISREAALLTLWIDIGPVETNGLAG